MDSSEAAGTSPVTQRAPAERVGHSGAEHASASSAKARTPHTRSTSVEMMMDPNSPANDGLGEHTEWYRPHPHLEQARTSHEATEKKSGRSSISLLYWFKD